MVAFRLPRDPYVTPRCLEMEQRRAEICAFLERHDLDPQDVRAVSFGESDMMVEQYHVVEGRKHTVDHCGVPTGAFCPGCYESRDGDRLVESSHANEVCMLDPVVVPYREPVTV